MLRPNLRKGCKSWAKRGRDFGNSLSILMLDVGMGPQYLLLYEKRIVIRFWDGLQWVNWLGNPRYPINSTKFLPTFGGKNKFV
jgi:hypothetical protein